MNNLSLILICLDRIDQAFDYLNELILMASIPFGLLILFLQKKEGGGVTHTRGPHTEYKETILFNYCSLAWKCKKYTEASIVWLRYYGIPLNNENSYYKLLLNTPDSDMFSFPTPSPFAFNFP